MSCVSVVFQRRTIVSVEDIGYSYRYEMAPYAQMVALLLLIL